MKFAGIDYGLARTGLAVSDPEGKMAFPLETLHFADYPDRRSLLSALAGRIAASGAQAVVMGLPLTRDGQESLTTRQIRNITRRLQRRIPLPFYFMPEELSSGEARADLRAAGCPAHKVRAVLDQQAAVRILDSFLALPPHMRRNA
ncbi:MULTISPECIES: Holliday junction resolvase RuvX [unclassified Desulfovibrio]|uniref:Holliday junction resolvase RuvX n=1 Tax=unclassified Desulfovibrio TaxID=2593640 RepID=UPI000F5DB2A2|nr:MULTISPECIES: Holliday junction resolvase RuvX [unclassified Desulfovibrio]RRD69753.1 Holliday junction resolvase RuvX [Desulfovibrio sp. OH1209_COT-279]RRD86378.1 Holliday junction resolvase RuvX [Desulfovibrio sp. OH1186_COT-070]